MMKNEVIPVLPLEALQALERFTSYGWSNTISARMLNTQFHLSLCAHDVALIRAQPDPFAPCHEHDAPKET